MPRGGRAVKDASAVVGGRRATFSTIFWLFLTAVALMVIRRGNPATWIKAKFANAPGFAGGGGGDFGGHGASGGW
jgi:hypothetical protein